MPESAGNFVTWPTHMIRNPVLIPTCPDNNRDVTDKNDKYQLVVKQISSALFRPTIKKLITVLTIRRNTVPPGSSYYKLQSLHPFLTHHLY